MKYKIYSVLAVDAYTNNKYRFVVKATSKKVAEEIVREQFDYSIERYRVHVWLLNLTENNIIKI